MRVQLLLQALLKALVMGALVGAAGVAAYRVMEGAGGGEDIGCSTLGGAARTAIKMLVNNTLREMALCGWSYASSC